MEFQVERARDYFARAEPLFPLIGQESRYCPILLKRLYSRILDHLERQGYDVFRRRPRLRLDEKLRLVAATWLESRTGLRAYFGRHRAPRRAGLRPRSRREEESILRSRSSTTSNEEIGRKTARPEGLP
jgi:hypothetical protein